MTHPKMGAGGLVVPKSKPEGAASVFALTEAIKRKERERAVALIQALRNEQTPSLYPYVIADGVDGIPKWAENYYGSQSAIQGWAARLIVLVTTVEEQFK